VRLRMKRPLNQLFPSAQIPRDSKLFKRFVSQFLSELAELLRCPVNRYVDLLVWLVHEVVAGRYTELNYVHCSCTRTVCSSTCTPALSLLRL